MTKHKNPKKLKKPVKGVPSTGKRECLSASCSECAYELQPLEPQQCPTCGKNTDRPMQYISLPVPNGDGTFDEWGCEDIECCEECIAALWDVAKSRYTAGFRRP